MKKLLLLVLGCIAYFNVSAQKPPTITALGPTTFCYGGTVTLQSNKLNGNQWYKNGVIISGAISATYTANASGTYAVKNAGHMSNSIAVTVNPIPTAPTLTANGSTSFCAGGSVALQSSTASGYAWYKNGVLISGATSQTYSATQAGTYTVKAVSNGCYSSGSNAVSVHVLAAPVAAITPSGPINICNGSSQTLSPAMPGDGDTYLWSSGETTESISVTTSGTYYLTVTRVNGCSKTSSGVTVNVITPNPVISASGSLTFCKGDSVILRTDPFSSYLWSTGETTNSITVYESGVYSVTVTDESGCTGTSATVTVTVNSLPDANAGPDQIIYTGYGNQDATLSANHTSNLHSFHWSTGETTSEIKVSPPSTSDYTVTVLDENSCEASDMATVFVVDVSCGNNGDKVLICHDGNTLCVSQHAVASHLSHGDQLGSCNTQLARIANTKSSDLPDGVFPNPSDGRAFALVINDCLDSDLQVKIYDLNMKECHAQNIPVDESHRVNTKLQPATKLPAGVYFITAKGEKSQYNFKLVIHN